MPGAQASTTRARWPSQTRPVAQIIHACHSLSILRLVEHSTEHRPVYSADAIVVGGAQEVALRSGAALRQGHLATIRDYVHANHITDVVLNFNASGSHLTRIAHALQKPDAPACGPAAGPVIVKCRTAVVLEIFRKHASTAEARLQVQLAELRYQAARVVRRRDAQGRLVFGMAGHEAEVVSARGRGGQGAVGGSGETELAVQAARMRGEIARLQRQLEGVRRQRQMLRAHRQRLGHRVVALVGYTNAGKSSLMSALCHEDVGAADQLFATLDTKIRSAAIGGGESVLLVDTVGFIQGLPLSLVAAFQATLDEATQAHLLVHVIDAASDDALQQRHTVMHTLRELGMSEEDLRHRVLEVWNKADCLQPSSKDPPPHRRPPTATSRPGASCSAALKTSPEARLQQEELWAAVCARIQAAVVRSGKPGARELAQHLSEAWRKGHAKAIPASAAGTTAQSEQAADGTDCQTSGTAERRRPAAQSVHVVETCPPLESHSLEFEGTTKQWHDRLGRRQKMSEHTTSESTTVAPRGGHSRDAGTSMRLKELLALVVPEERDERSKAPADVSKVDSEEQHAGQSRVSVPLVVSAITGQGLDQLKHAMRQRLAYFGMPGNARDGG